MTDAEVHATKAKEAFDRLIAFRPDLLLVSAGFDSYGNDPLTNMRLEAEHFYRFGTWLHGADIPVAAILEGGYGDDLPGMEEASYAGGAERNRGGARVQGEWSRWETERV